MQLINRHVVLIRPKEPFLDWINQQPGTRKLTLDELRQYECTVVLVPSFDFIPDAQAYLDPVKPTLFEMQLEGWAMDSTSWPAERTRELFDEWFDLEVHSMVWDAGNTAIMGEETLITALDYPSPVSELLTFGDCRNFAEWPDYVGSFGFGPEHIPDLIRMATDAGLSQTYQETLEVWAPVHAWRALAQLHAEEAAEPLMALFHELESDDWMMSEMPMVYEEIGEAAIPPLTRYLADRSHSEEARSIAAECLERIALRHPHVRDECVAVLTNQLEQFQNNGSMFNSALVSGLLSLNALEALPAIERVFAAGGIDETFVNWRDVREELGITTPHPRSKQRMRVRRRHRRRR